MVKRQLLGDHAAERKAHDMKLLQSERIAKRQSMLHHLQDGVRRFARGTGDLGIVEQDDVVVGGEAVGDLRVLVVQVSREVVHEDKRELTPLSPTPVGESITVHLNEPRWYG